MTRGIHLKQLTRAHLELLGLPEAGGQSLQDTPLVDGGETLEQGRLPLGDMPRETSPSPSIGPPANPPVAPSQGAQAEPELDWQPIDLRALAREIRQELEITLRLLDRPSDQGARPD